MEMRSAVFAPERDLAQLSPNETPRGSAESISEAWSARFFRESVPVSCAYGPSEEVEPCG